MWALDFFINLPLHLPPSTAGHWCKICGGADDASFREPGSLKRHMEEIHPAPDDFVGVIIALLVC